MKDLCRPRIAVLPLPNHPDEAAPGPQGPGNIGKSRRGILKEHDAEAADAKVEPALRKRIGLRIPGLESDVLQACVFRAATSQDKHFLRNVKAKDGPFDGGNGGVTARLSGTASDIEHPVALANLCCKLQMPIVPFQLGIVKTSPVHRLSAHAVVCGASRRLARAAS